MPDDVFLCCYLLSYLMLLSQFVALGQLRRRWRGQALTSKSASIA
jgi:hypothetical protein